MRQQGRTLLLASRKLRVGDFRFEACWKSGHKIEGIRDLGSGHDVRLSGVVVSVGNVLFDRARKQDRFLHSTSGA
jgi:hypothetical protein